MPAAGSAWPGSILEWVNQGVMMNRYIWDRDTNEVRRADDLMEWARWFEAGGRTLARDEVRGVVISTVFLGIDHRFRFVGPPVLWETMCFTSAGGSPDDAVWDDFQMRHTGREDALNAHRALVAHITAGGDPDSFCVGDISDG